MRPVVAVVQARMTSTRLPGKVLRQVMGRPLLAYQVERMRRARRIDRIVIATTVNATDDPIVAFCENERIDVTRGPEDDVLARYAVAAERFAARTVVRLTSDCPLIDPALIDKGVDRFAESGADYLSNMLAPTFPYGMAVEVFHATVLQEAAQEATEPAEREHVTPFIYWRPERFRLASWTMERDLSSHRWTVDTPEDLELVTRILETVYPANPLFGLQEVLSVLEQHPEWAKINAHVQQKSAAGTPKDQP